MSQSDRDNREFLDDRIRNTLRVFELLGKVAPDPVYPSEAAEILDLTETECLTILINLAYDEWARETEKGFQTLGQIVRRMERTTHETLDSYFSGGLNEPVPMRRLPDGSWDKESGSLKSRTREFKRSIFGLF
jgi:hypothetical protein